MRALKVKKPPVLPIFGRVVTLLFAMIICAGGAFTWWAKGISWIYDEDNNGAFPLLSCPREFYSYAGTVPLGDFCHISFYAGLELKKQIVSIGLSSGDYGCDIPTSREDPVECRLAEECPSVCRMQDGSGICVTGSALPETPLGEPEPMCRVLLGVTVTGPFFVDMECSNLFYGSYCDSKFAVTASTSLAMRGILFGAIFLSILWLLAEFVLRKVDIDLRKERAVGMARMAVELPAKRGILRKSLEERWRVAERCPEFPSDENSHDFLHDSFSIYTSASPRRQDEDANIGRLFSSSSWRRRLAQWQKLRSEKSSTFKVKEIARSVFLYTFFVSLLGSTFYIVLLISPQNISVAETWYTGLLGKVTFWSMGSWVDYVIFLDILVDTGMFILAALAVKWPKAPLFSRHIQEQISGVVERTKEPATVEELELSSQGGELDYSADDDSSASSATVSFILNQSLSSDTCLMIACHLSTMTSERCETFAGTLRAAISVFPPRHIFVCDNGPWLNPQDETHFVTKQVHPDINYLYIPEGNKTFAFYWTNKYWIPFLERCGVLPHFTYAIIIDDDVPLPTDLHIPHEHLKKNPDIKAVHFPITATTPDRNPGLLVMCQDIEYKLAAVHKLFQASLSRALSCHGAIALWDREAMAEVLLEHDTVFNGEDLYMGLCLLRKRDSSKIISCAQSIVPTYAPDSWAVLFRQRVKSWELTSHKKTFTFLLEIINPVSFIHIPSLILKPYFIQELLSILLDWLRIFLLIGLLLRDTLGLLLMTAFFTLVLHAQLVLFQFVILRDRPDLRSSFITVLTFPLYKLCNLFFRVCALCQNLLVYSHERKGIKISLREDEIRDLPPLPPHHLVDWFTIWHEPEALITEKQPLKRSKSGSGQITPRRFRM